MLYVEVQYTNLCIHLANSCVAAGTGALWNISVTVLLVNYVNEYFY